MGAHDPRLAEYFRSQGTTPGDIIYHRAKRIAITKQEKGGYEPILSPEKQVILNGDRVELSSPDAKEAEDSQKKTSGRNTSNPKSTGQDASSQAEGDVKHKNFVTVGKLASTAAFGVMLADGAKHLSTPADDKDPKKKADSGKAFMHAVEVAAAVAGIAIVWWKGDAIFKGAGKVFNRGA